MSQVSVVADPTTRSRGALLATAWRRPASCVDTVSGGRDPGDFGKGAIHEGVDAG
jgi:hypothetical protein